MDLHFILDPSAFVYGGIGKLKKWSQLYSSDRNSLQKANVLFYVPHYTLKELDFLKKVYNPLISSNAKESIRFIDSEIAGDFGNQLGLIDSIDDDFNDLRFADSDSDDNTNGIKGSNSDGKVVDFESYNRQREGKDKKSLRNHSGAKLPTLKFYLEGNDEMGPPWRIASGYRHATPLKKDLPSHFDNGNVGVYGMKIAGGFCVDPSTKASPLTHDPFAELERDTSSEEEEEEKEEEDEEDDDGESEDTTNCISDEFEKAQVPQNLKKLIRYTVQKHYIDNKNLPSGKKIPWFVITEEAITRTWLESFGFHVIDLNVAERLLSGSVTVKQFLEKVESLDKEKESPVVSEVEAHSGTTDLNQSDSKVVALPTSESETQTSFTAVDKPMLFDPVTGEFVSVEEFKGSRNSFKRSRGRGGFQRGRGGRRNKSKNIISG